MTEIFVFGSNEAGRHGKGAALDARRLYGAQYGVGAGRTGNAYAIPTKDRNLRTLPLTRIRQYVDEFVAYAGDNPGLMFRVTAIGTGLAGYRHDDIAPMFAQAPANCRLPAQWRRLLMRGDFNVEIERQPIGSTHAHLTGTLTRAADGEPYRVSLWLSFERRPHPETDEIVKTRVLSGQLSPADSAPPNTTGATMEEETPCELDPNRIKLFENLAEAAAITRDGRPGLRRQATFYGLASIDGVVERVAAWELDKIEWLPGRLLGHTRPFTPKPGLDMEDQMEQARTALQADDPVRPQPPVPAIQARAPRAGQGTS